jgi:hypothetical protein
MPKRDTIFPSKYLKCADLKGKPVIATVERAPVEILKGSDGREDTKTVLYFVGTAKMLPLNMTNWDSVAEVTGEDDTDAWPGHKLELYPAKTELKGKIVDCIRIRAPAQRDFLAKKPTAAAKPPSPDAMGDEIPF